MRACNTRLKQKKTQVKSELCTFIKGMLCQVLTTSSAVEQCFDKWVPTVLFLTSPRRTGRRKPGRVGNINYEVPPPQTSTAASSLLQSQSKPQLTMLPLYI